MSRESTIFNPSPQLSRGESFNHFYEESSEKESITEAIGDVAVKSVLEEENEISLESHIIRGYN